MMRVLLLLLLTQHFAQGSVQNPQSNVTALTSLSFDSGGINGALEKIVGESMYRTFAVTVGISIRKYIVEHSPFLNEGKHNNIISKYRIILQVASKSIKASILSSYKEMAVEPV
jgi:hypothetical protein